MLVLRKLPRHKFQQSQADVAKMIADAIQQEHENLWAEITLQINNSITNHIPSQVNSSVRSFAFRTGDQDDPHDDAHPEGENNVKTIVGKQEKKLVSPFQQKPTSIIQSFQRDPKASALSLVNQDLLYLKKGNSRPEKIVLSIHKFPAVIFPDDDIEERTSGWIIARRANGSIVSITKPDYKNLNKNDIEDLYMLIVNDKLGVESYQKKVNLTAPTITFSSIEKYTMFFIISKLVYGIIYKNSKKEKRVMRHQEIHNFCDATLKRVLEGLKSYNNNVKHGYVTPSLSKEDAEYLQLFEEEIEEWLKHRDRMRRWEMYVNGRPLRSRRECP
ncbi:hypothetical protein Tco_0924970 [Tanacetum coccineum]|uniref:Uncharacterized protein n=1 Tax=Tanacetum coccineum TaxID=301880 RepID=A0ABQ5D5G9_9ASTR